MEENDYTSGQETTDPNPLPIPQITLESLGFLNITAKWTKFLAILGFVGIGIMLAAGIFMGIALSAASTLLSESHFPFLVGLFGLIYIILAAVYFFPVLYLNNFSNNISKAVSFRQTEFLTTALSNIKKHFKYLGIMAIVFIVCYPVIIIIAVVYSMSHVTHGF